MDPYLKNTRNRRSKKVGASWTARSRRLRAYLDSLPDDEDSTQNRPTSPQSHARNHQHLSNLDAHAPSSPPSSQVNEPAISDARTPSSAINEPEHHATNLGERSGARPNDEPNNNATDIDALVPTPPSPLELEQTPQLHSPRALAPHPPDCTPSPQLQSPPAATEGQARHVSALLVAPSPTSAGGLFSLLGDIKDAFSEVRRRLSIMTRETLLGIMSLYGCGAMTVKQYEFLCNVVTLANSSFSLPSASSLRRVKWPFFISKIFPKSTITQLQRKKKKKSTTCDNGTDSADAPPTSAPTAQAQQQSDSTAHPPTTQAQAQQQSDSTARPATTQAQEDGDSAAQLPTAQAHQQGGPSAQEQVDATSQRRPRSAAQLTSPQPQHNNASSTSTQAQPQCSTRERDGAEQNVTCTESTKTSPVVILPVSEWAKYDFSNVLLRDDIVSTSRERRIEDSSICSESDKVAVQQDHLLISDGSTVFPARRRDKVSFNCTSADPQPFPSDFRAHGECEDGRNTEGSVSFTFTVGAYGHAQDDNSSAYADFVSEPLSSLSEHERFLLRYLKVCSASRDKEKEEPDSGTQPHFRLKSGDVCSVLLPSSHTHNQRITTFGVFVSRFWRTKTDRRNQLFFLFNCDLSDPSDATITCKFESAVKGIPILCSIDNDSVERDDTIPTPPPVTGTLSDGRLFYVYRILLYCDDFVPRSSLFPKGSVGGVYFIPLSLNLRRRRGGCSIRTVSLTPTNVSTNEVLDFIIPDIINGITNGIETVDADGRTVTIFLDVVGFIGDYPESAKVMDLMNHAARAPCTHCSFRHRKMVDAANYAYSIAIHSYHSSFGRSLRKTLAVRSSNITAEELNFLGMKDGSVDNVSDVGRWPLIKLGCAIESAKHLIPTTTDGKPVVSGSFNPYNQNAVAPDHLLAGIGKFMVETTFVQLNSDTDRKRLEVLVSAKLKELGFGTHSALYNYKKKKINSISMSTFYAFVTIIGPLLRTMKYTLTFKPLYFLELFSKLLALTFWWPIAPVDGVEAFDYVHGPQQGKYHNDMLALVNKLVERIGEECRSSAVVKKRLDRPNIHRLLELYRNTIPRFSHAMFCLDMGFERNHQPLKSALLQNTNDESQISAVYKSLGRDWFGRLTELIVHKGASNNDTSRNSNVHGTPSSMRRSFRRLLLGDIVNRIPSHTPECLAFFDSVDKQLDTLLDTDLTNLILKWHGHYITTWGNGTWTAIPQTRREQAVGRRTHNCSDVLQDTTITNLQRFLQTSTTSSTPNLPSVHLYPKASYIQNLGPFSRRRYNHHNIQPGDFIQCYSESVPSGTANCSNTIIPSEAGSGSLHVLQVKMILGCTSDEPWALVLRGESYTSNENAGTDELSAQADTDPAPKRENTYTFPALTTTSARLLRLGPTVRKAFGIHACDLDSNGCRIDLKQKKVIHSHSDCGQCTFTVLTRKSGFPPRRS